ncbi:MAG: sulfoxide reductase heme-binding subunit YedZ [Gammaproteobacteria bacterium]|jgi:methionine sulfoxide reductase heme-binding subunit
MPSLQQGIRWSKVPLFLLCLVPFGLLLLRAANNDLGANPVEALTHETGDWALRFLLASLAVTPLRMLTGKAWLLRYRRMLGLFAFFYAVAHFVIYLWIDQAFLWTEIAADIIKRPYITVGFAAFLILLPLAVTSTKGMVRRLGRRWAMLHRSVYAAALLAVLHFLWLVKADYREPGIYLAIFILLMLFRTPLARRRFRRA